MDLIIYYVPDDLSYLPTKSRVVGLKKDMLRTRDSS